MEVNDFSMCLTLISTQRYEDNTIDDQLILFTLNSNVWARIEMTKEMTLPSELPFEENYKK